jgi:hypothetical protein
MPRSSTHIGIGEFSGVDSFRTRENAHGESARVVLEGVSGVLGGVGTEEAGEDLLDPSTLPGDFLFSIAELGVRAFRTTFALSSRNRRVSWSRYPEHVLPARLHCEHVGSN